MTFIIIVANTDLSLLSHCLVSGRCGGGGDPVAAHKTHAQIPHLSIPPTRTATRRQAMSSPSQPDMSDISMLAELSGAILKWRLFAYKHIPRLPRVPGTFARVAAIAIAEMALDRGHSLQGYIENATLKRDAWILDEQNRRAAQIKEIEAFARQRVTKEVVVPSRIWGPCPIYNIQKYEEQKEVIKGFAPLAEELVRRGQALADLITRGDASQEEIHTEALATLSVCKTAINTDPADPCFDRRTYRPTDELCDLLEQALADPVPKKRADRPEPEPESGSVATEPLPAAPSSKKAKRRSSKW